VVTIGLGADAPTHESCVLHPFETAERLCHECGRWHCDGCLVTPWGPRKPALCISCAIGRSGVRRSSGAPKVRSAREIRTIEKAERRAERDEHRRGAVVTAGGLTRTPLPSVDLDGSRRRRSLRSRLRPA
jgi:hypothetical protein